MQLWLVAPRMQLGLVARWVPTGEDGLPRRDPAAQARPAVPWTRSGRRALPAIRPGRCALPWTRSGRRVPATHSGRRVGRATRPGQIGGRATLPDGPGGCPTHPGRFGGRPTRLGPGGGEMGRRRDRGPKARGDGEDGPKGTGWDSRGASCRNRRERARRDNARPALAYRTPTHPGTRQTGRPTGPRERRSAARWRRFVKSLGGDLLSHPASQAVPSALEGLTSGFGMGPGVSPPLWPPKRSGAPGIAGTLQNYTASACNRSWLPSPRPISTGQLHTLLCFHFRPINPVV